MLVLGQYLHFCSLWSSYRSLLFSSSSPLVQMPTSFVQKEKQSQTPRQNLLLSFLLLLQLEQLLARCLRDQLTQRVSASYLELPSPSSRPPLELLCSLLEWSLSPLLNLLILCSENYCYSYPFLLLDLTLKPVMMVMLVLIHLESQL